MSQQTYQYGETVDIVIRGAKVDSHSERGLFVTIPGAQFGTSIPVADGEIVAAVKVTLVEPADGPPQDGDLWADHLGTRYVAFLQRRNHGPDEVMLHNGQSGYRMAELCEHRFVMRLVYREPVAQPVEFTIAEQDAAVAASEADAHAAAVRQAQIAEPVQNAEVSA